MRNDLARALEWYKKALAVDPDFGDAYYNMACVYALEGQKEMALRYLQIAALNGYATAEGIDGDPDLESVRRRARATAPSCARGCEGARGDGDARGLPDRGARSGRAAWPRCTARSRSPGRAPGSTSR